MTTGALAPFAKRATARQNAAAKARDAVALRVASAELVVAAWRTPRSGLPAPEATVYDRLLGSLILTGQGPAAAATLREVACRPMPSGEIFLRGIPESEWRVDELGLLVELRLLGHEWHGLPGLPTRPDQVALSPRARLRLRHAHTLFSALAGGDAVAASKAIAAFGRDDPSAFSVLAYALFREARLAGIAVTIPRKYAF